MSRTATAILSSHHLRHNVSVLKQKAPFAKIVAMIKANGYGHGIRSVAKRLEGYVDLLGVASIDEALALRKAGIQCPILLVEGVFEPSELLVAACEKFHLVFHSQAQVDWLLRAHLPVPISAWLKIDTGLGRLGFSLEDGLKHFKTFQNLACVNPHLHLMSHFSCADNKDHPLNQRQINLFQAFVEQATQLCGDEKKAQLSFCNSAAIFNFSSQAHDAIRPGLALFGVSPLANTTASDLGLLPVMTLQSSLIAIDQKKKGATIGYGARYTCPTDMYVGVIAFGYGDGYPITARDGTPVLINGVRCPLIGRVSMDMMMVDLTPLMCIKSHEIDAKIGDSVILWGENLPIEEVVSYTQNLTYDMLTGIQHRVKFLWVD